MSILVVPCRIVPFVCAKSHSGTAMQWHCPDEANAASPRCRPRAYLPTWSWAQDRNRSAPCLVALVRIGSWAKWWSAYHGVTRNALERKTRLRRLSAHGACALTSHLGRFPHKIVVCISTVEGVVGPVNLFIFLRPIRLNVHSKWNLNYLYKFKFITC